MNLHKLNYLTELLTNLISLNTVLVLCLIFTFYFDRQAVRKLCCVVMITWCGIGHNSTMQFKQCNTKLIILCSVLPHGFPVRLSVCLSVCGSAPRHLSLIRYGCLKVRVLRVRFHRLYITTAGRSVSKYSSRIIVRGLFCIMIHK